MIKEDLNRLREKIFTECIETGIKGQKEYVLNEDAFDNFNRLSSELGIDRKFILWVYAKKHADGIVNYLKGHKSQREDVRGRIKDLIVYMTILWGMIEEEEAKFSNPNVNVSPDINELRKEWSERAGVKDVFSQPTLLKNDPDRNPI